MAERKILIFSYFLLDLWAFYGIMLSKYGFIRIDIRIHERREETDEARGFIVTCRSWPVTRRAGERKNVKCQY